MNSIITVAAHECRLLFKSPLAWITLAVVEFLLAVLFLILLNQFLNPSPWLAGHGVTEVVIAGLLQVAGIILLLVTPFITMRIFSEERRTGTINLLYSSPVSLTQLVLGKYLGVMIFMLLMLLLIALMPLSLMMGTDIDLLQFSAGLLGLLLLMGGFAAIGLFVSTLTSQPSVAAIITFGILFMLWIINLASGTGSDWFREVFTYISLLNHYNNLINGLFNTVDVIYYLIIITGFVALSIWRLDSERFFQ
ncbi:MAG TPA: ABC transporter permease subunit [Gammaproteobacteria bacterium]|nr:ABC transporter permease subunit [Gammaproteobacteria bacterium]